MQSIILNIVLNRASHFLIYKYIENKLKILSSCTKIYGCLKYIFRYPQPGKDVL